MTYGCINYPVMETEVIDAKVPEFEGPAIEAPNTRATSIRVEATISKENGAVITERGFYYGKSNPPKPENGGTKVKDEGMDADKRIGRYVMNIDGLVHNTTYYILPYAINAVGTGYPEQAREIITKEGIAKINTRQPNSVRAASAIVGGQLISAGEGTISKIGIYVYDSVGIEKINTIIYPSDVMVGEEFVHKLTGLATSTRYYVQAFVINTFGESVGNKESFYTWDGIPKIVESDIVKKGYTDVTLTSTVTNGDDETMVIVDRGFCWAIGTVTTEPDTNNTVVHCTPPGFGVFEGEIKGLLPDKIYYARSFAKSNFGKIVYGEALLVRTIKDIPTVDTYDVAAASILNGNADVGGVIDNPGANPVISSGICWSSTKFEPTLSDSIVYLTAGANGEFSGKLTRLRGGVTYYVRAFATNANGTGYGDVKQFTTPRIFTVGLEPLSAAMRRTSSMAYFAIEGELYILGGDIGEKYTDELWKYSIAENKWHPCWSYDGGPLKWQFGVSYGRGAFVYGGFSNGNGNERPGISYYNANTNLWEYYTGPPDSAIVNQTIGYADNTSVYFIGGLSRGTKADSARQDVWNFHWAFKTWQKKTDFPVKQYGGVALTIDNIAYVGMGRGTNDVCNDSLWITDDGALTWKFLTSYHITTSVLGSVVCNRRLYMIDESYFILEYNPETGIWTKKSEIPPGRRAFHCIYSVGNKIYFGMSSNSIAVYDPSWDN